MEVKPRYKQTDVGVIPTNWDVKTIGEVFSIAAGGDFDPTRSSSIQDAEYRYPIYSNAVSNAGLYGFCSYHDHQAGSITVTARGTLGVAHFRSHDFTAIGRVLVLQPRQPVDGRFFSEFMNHHIDFAVESTGVPQLTAPQISKYRIAVPPLSEQQAIAVVLSDLDALIDSLDRLIAKKRAIKQGAMQQLLAGKTRLPGFSGDWEVKKLDEILDYEQPRAYLVNDTEYDESSGVPVLTAGKSFILGYSNEQEGICTNLPVIIFDDFTTASKYVDFPFKVKSSAMKLLRTRDGSADLRFMFEKMQTISFVPGSHKRHYISEYRHIGIDVPSLEEQQAIAAVLSDMDAEIAALERRHDKTRALKQGMMQELLTGRTRLV